ncbi:MAG: hypothetical protein E7631_11220 [Ruminococcaceae bacterium]|nr:hypothetical protein [Oscillospiraceae bacterium]
METRYGWDAFYAIGYTKEEMTYWESCGLADGILEAASSESFYTAANAAVLLPYFDRETVFRFLTAYLSAFLLTEKTFRERLQQIIEKAGSGWEDILLDEYWDDAAHPILSCMGYLAEQDWEDALRHWTI